jgi:hypothetical protein
MAELLLRRTAGCVQANGCLSEAALGMQRLAQIVELNHFQCTGRILWQQNQE